MVDRHFASGGIHPCDDGEWVSYDDYSALESRIAELEKDAARLYWLISRSFCRGESCVQLLEEFGGFPYVGETKNEFVIRYIDEAMKKEQDHE